MARQSRPRSSGVARGAPRSRAAGATPTLPCLCATLRRAARAVTQLYDAELRPSGIRVTQLTLLQVLEARSGLIQTELGKLLALDSTTLSRTLRSLEVRGWIRSLATEDRRERGLVLTPAGRRQLGRTAPLWRRAQERFRATLGSAEWAQAMATLVELTHATRRARKERERRNRAASPDRS